MNHELLIWDGTGTQPAPTTFAQAGHTLERLETQRPGPNANFIALARVLQDQCSGAADAWAGKLVAQAQAWSEAVWPLSLPPDQHLSALRIAVEQATALGLTVLDDALGLVFLPGGQVLPPEMQAQWADMQRQLDAAPPSLSQAEVTQLTATLLRDLLAPHGFAPGPRSKDWDVEFVRPTRDGHQTVAMRITNRYGFRCMFRCGHRSEPVETLFSAVFGDSLRVPETVWFHPTAFVGARTGFVSIENTGEIRAALAVLERHALPVLDLARQAGGLDKLMNEPQRFPFTYPNLHPLGPQTLAAELRNSGGRSCLKPLIVAWMAHNPHFDGLVASLREFVKPRVDVTDADITQLVDWLRQQGALASI